MSLHLVHNMEKCYFFGHCSCQILYIWMYAVGLFLSTLSITLQYDSIWRDIQKDCWISLLFQNGGFFLGLSCSNGQTSWPIRMTFGFFRYLCFDLSVQHVVCVCVCVCLVISPAFTNCHRIWNPRTRYKASHM